GNVQVIEYQGPYSAAPNADPIDHQVRRAIAEAFYQVQPDDYEFLMVFTDFPVEFNGYGGFNFTVANHVEGIGRPLFDGTSAFGSDGRLLSYIDMGDRLRLPMLLGDHGYQSVLNTLMHEFMHQWGVYVHFRDSDGQS